MAFIPEDKLLEIKDAASIEEVVGQYVKLTQKGKNLSGLCPFLSWFPSCAWEPKWAQSLALPKPSLDRKGVPKCNLGTRGKIRGKAQAGKPGPPTKVCF